MTSHPRSVILRLLSVLGIWSSSLLTSLHIGSGSFLNGHWLAFSRFLIIEAFGVWRGDHNVEDLVSTKLTLEIAIEWIDTSHSNLWCTVLRTKDTLTFGIKGSVNVNFYRHFETLGQDYMMPLVIDDILFGIYGKSSATRPPRKVTN